MKNIAQINLYDPGQGNLKGFGKLGLETANADQGLIIFASFISSTIGLITLIAIIWFVFSFITGAIGIITSGGEKNSLESSKKKMTNAVIGFVVTVLGIFIIKFVGYLMGFDNILDINTFFTNLTIK